MNYNSSKIETFEEILDYIMYDWDYMYTLSKGDDGVYCVNKLSIGPNFLIYKTECHEIENRLYKKVEKLYNLLQEPTDPASENDISKIKNDIFNYLKNNSSVSRGVYKIPISSRNSLVEYFKNKGYQAYLYRDHKFLHVSKIV